MSSAFRPTTPDDLPAVRAFLKTAFDAHADPPFLDPDLMKWKYWEPRADWEGPRGFVLERDGRIAGHVGIWPMALDAGAVRGIQMIDWGAAKDAPGAGISMVQKLAAQFDFIYSIGGSDATRRVLPAFGFREFAVQWSAARPLRPLAGVLTHQHRNWKLVPRLVRNMGWAMWPRAPKTAWNVEPIQPRDLPADIGAPRTPAFFDYLLRCPRAKVTLHGIRDRGALEGYFALSVVRGQARLAGLWLREPGRVAWKAAFGLAQQAAKSRAGACELVAAGTSAESLAGAMEAGLRPSVSTPVYLMARRGSPCLATGFEFQFCEDDSWFLDTGQPAYRT